MQDHSHRCRELSHYSDFGAGRHAKRGVSIISARFAHLFALPNCKSCSCLCMQQYMPKKPIKRGFKVWVRGDATNGYIWTGSICMKDDTGWRKRIGETCCRATNWLVERKTPPHLFRQLLYIHSTTSVIVAQQTLCMWHHEIRLSWFSGTI